MRPPTAISNRREISRSWCRWSSDATRVPGTPIGKPAIRLAGALEARAAVQALAAISPDRRRPTRRCEPRRSTRWRRSVGRPASAPIEALAGDSVPERTRLLAIAALARLDLQEPRRRAAPRFWRSRLSRAATSCRSLGAFLDRQGGSEMLAKAIAGRGGLGRFGQARPYGLSMPSADPTRRWSPHFRVRRASPS